MMEDNTTNGVGAGSGTSSVDGAGPEDYVVLKTLSELLKVDYRTARKYCAVGWVRATRHGGEYHITVSEVLRFQREGNHPNPIPIPPLPRKPKQKTDQKVGASK